MFHHLNAYISLHLQALKPWRAWHCKRMLYISRRKLACPRQRGRLNLRRQPMTVPIYWNKIQGATLPALYTVCIIVLYF